MESFKLKISVGDAEIELEGDGELVHTIFQELRVKGLGELISSANNFEPKSDNVEINEKASASSQKSNDTANPQDPTVRPDESLPTLENVVLQDIPKTEADWLLVYVMYCSKQGTTFFTKEDLRAKYDETKRMTAARSKNFTKNIRSLVSNDYISAVNDSQFRLEDAGLAKVKSILFNSTDDKKGKRSHFSSRKKSQIMYNMLELGLSEEQRVNFKAFWTKHKHSSNMDKAVLAAYWLKNEKGIDDFTADHLFTMLRTIEENTSFDLGAAINNAKNLKGYFIPDSVNGAYKIYHIGEDHVKTLEIEEEANK